MKHLFKVGAILFFAMLCTSNYAQQFRYGEALQKSLLFYEAQQAGKLPNWNRVSWRGDSGLDHGQDVGLDLTGGWYDAGDHVKFNLPMASSVTMLAWGGITYKDAYERSGQMVHLKRNLKFALDYMIKCHTGPTELYVQIGNGEDDHSHWVSAEVMQTKIPQRISYKITADKPGTEVAAEFAAAFAASSILFQDSNPGYSATLLRHAEELYQFADEFRGVYSESVPEASAFYRSFSGFQDELPWGAAWLYRATNKSSYLAKARLEYDKLDNELGSDVKAFGFAQSWDDKRYGSYVLMAELTGEAEYIADAERHLDFWTTGYEGRRVTYSPGGQAHLIQWGSLRYMGNTALLASILVDKVDISAAKKKTYSDFIKNQIDYALGDNPINRSFMCGFGNDPANNPHHRGTHGTWTNNLQGDPQEASHTLVGALVGGPREPNDQFEDDRGDFIANEVATDYNAGFTGVLAKLYNDFGGAPLANFPIDEVPTRNELEVSAKFNSNNATSYTPSLRFANKTAWPARITDQISMRYFFNISEALAVGKSIDDFTVTKGFSQGPSTIEINAWDATAGIYYVDISLEGDEIAPVGQSEHRREVQLNIRVDGDTPFDASNDWSAQGLGTGSDYEVVNNIPVYDNGVLVFGQEPSGGETPVASFTATPESGKAPLEVSFDASASSDPNGDTLTYTWNFGNGESSTSVDPVITFEEIGSYLVTLTVSDGTNTSTEATKTITVEDGNTAPVASFIASPEAGVAPATISFDASASTDADGDSLTYFWDFGDGTQDLGVTVNHLYEEEGTYEVSLTVSDGFKESTITNTITVTDGSPVASFTVSAESGVAPLSVTFDATGSTDPTGGTLTYSWDLGNGETASTVTTSAVYAEVGQVTITLTVTNSNGDQDQATRTITVTDDQVVGCSFGTPISNPLSSINTSFSEVHVLGQGGPDLSNVSRFTINWDLENNGLYQLAFNTTNGNPDFYVNLTSSAQSLGSAQPKITLSNSGIAGLDGVYDVTIDNGNFVMVSTTGSFTLYFSDSTTAPDCEQITDPTVVEGGTITGGPFIFTVNDGIADFVDGITLLGNKGANSQWVITDEDANILGLPASPEDVNFDEAPPGTCLIWHLSFNGELTGAAVGNNAADLEGNFDLSNPLAVSRLDSTDTGGDNCKFGTPNTNPLSSINERFKYVYTLGADASTLSNIREFNINWSLENVGLYNFAVNTTDGNPSWYLDLKSNLTHSFDSDMPEVTLTSTGLEGFDGTYYVAIDNGNFVMVSKDSDAVIYFSNDESAPVCEDGKLRLSNLNENNKSLDINNYSFSIYPNPSNSRINITTSFAMNNAKLHLVDITGHMVKNFSISDGSRELSLKIGDLANGIYLLEVLDLDTGFNSIQKLIKNN